jgi:hypothetical protein
VELLLALDVLGLLTNTANADLRSRMNNPLSCLSTPCPFIMFSLLLWYSDCNSWQARGLRSI